MSPDFANCTETNARNRQKARGTPTEGQTQCYAYHLSPSIHDVHAIKCYSIVSGSTELEVFYWAKIGMIGLPPTGVLGSKLVGLLLSSTHPRARIRNNLPPTNHTPTPTLTHKLLLLIHSLTCRVLNCSNSRSTLISLSLTARTRNKI